MDLMMPDSNKDFIARKSGSVLLDLVEAFVFYDL